MVRLEEAVTHQWPHPEIQRPGRVRVAGEHLVWSYNPARFDLAIPEISVAEKGPPRHYVPDVRTLEKFVALADAPPEEIAAFAASFGVLGLCRKHGLPSTHQTDASPAPGFHVAILNGRAAVPVEDQENYRHLAERGFSNNCALDLQPPDEYREPLEGWRRYAREARALLRVAGELRLGRPGNAADWVSLGEELTDSTDLSFRRHVIGLHVDEWLVLGAVRPRLLWFDESTKVLFGSHSLFGTIATQLVLAIAGTRAVAFCTGCGAFFAPKRQARTDRNSYCPRCGRAAALRDADRRRREKNRRERASANTP